MGRFVSTVEKNSFTKAEVFTTPGTTTWTVPAGVTTAKVFVIGAGSCYRTTCFCFSSSNCCSGVATPRCDYCLNFVGHLPGAGGGYSEKTFTGLAAGSTMSISVGSIGGLSASVAAIGGTTVTANNATETAINWACISNSTARNNSNDNPLSIGLLLPVCGYINCISGYFNAGGTATGGDINRTGGKGVFIPYFTTDSCFDISSSGGGALVGCNVSSTYYTGYDFNFGGTRFNCACLNAYLVPTCCPNANCGACFRSASGTTFTCNCLDTYHSAFGSHCNTAMPWANCICYCLCGTYLCSASSGGSSAKYLIAGSGQRASIGSYGETDDFNINSVPIGIGAEAGSGPRNGLNAVSEVQISTLAGSSGSVSASTTFPCYIGFGQDHFTFVFGSNSSSWPCICVGALNVASSVSCYNLGFVRDQSLYRPSDSPEIPLSKLRSSTDGTVEDFKFGFGATTSAAGYGGGGNRLNPAGGQGAVVVIY